MKKLLLITLVVLLSTFSYGQVVCPPHNATITLTFYKPVVANLQVGHFVGCDPEQNVPGNVLTWSIVETQTMWKIVNGDVFVNDATAVNNSPLTTFSITVKLSDNGAITGGTTTPLSITSAVTLNEFNTVPVIGTQSFNVNENSSNGTVVGAVVATDVNSRQTKTYSIISGNTGGTFSINASTGNIVVTNSTLLNYESTTSFPLVVKVTDNGTVPLSAQATVTINVKDVNEAPVINDQIF
jgi:VCBS repeat-containing protein